MPEVTETPAVQTFTPEEEARYARWGLGVQGDGEPKVAPVATEEPANTTEETTEEVDETTTEDESEGGEAEQPHKKKSGVQRLKEKNRLADEARIRAEERARIAEERLSALETGKKPEEPKPATSTPAVVGKLPKPDINTWTGTHDEYLEARDAWLLSEFEAKQEAKAQEAKVQAERQTKAQTWAEKVTAAKAKYSDLDQVLNVPFATPAMQEVIVDSENGVDVAYFLAKNLDEARRIAALPPLAVARELGKLEARFAAAATTEKPVVAARTTQAPPPPTPVGARGVSTVDESKMSDAEWERHRRTTRTR